MSRKENLKLWRSRVKDWKDSKLSMTEWCRANNQTVDALYYWKKRIYKLETSPGLKKTTSGNFIEVPSYDEKPTNKNSGIELCIKDITIKLEQDFEEKTLSRVISILGMAS